VEAIALWPPWAWLLALVVYFAPGVIAALRGRSPLLIFTLTLLLGWTGFGWLAALVLALTGRADVVGHRRPSRSASDDGAFAGLGPTPAFDAFDDDEGGSGGEDGGGDGGGDA